MMNREESNNYWSALPSEERDKIRWRFYGETSAYDWERGPYKYAMDTIPILDKGYVALLDHMGTDIDIVNAARISFQRKSDTFNDNDRKLLRYLWNNRHTSPFEMVELKFVVKCPIFVARQWHRHRTWSYNEVSRRYTEEDVEFYTPHYSWLRKQSENNRQASEEHEFGFINETMFIASADVERSRYDKLLEDGVCREQARAVLPQSMYTIFYAKVDLANLLHFIDLRMDSHAQWEIQQYAEAIVEMISNVVPETMKIFMEGRNA